MQKSSEMKASTAACVVVLGLGGTIAGTGPSATEASNNGQQYQAAQLPIQSLLSVANRTSSALAGFALEAHQVAQIDSKDMGWSVWRDLLLALRQHLSRPEVQGVVITHGTDTLEETALLLHLLLPASKPVVLTAAMRPATATDADGPINLGHAISVATWAAQRNQGGVVAVMAGRVWAGAEVRKSHSWQIDAFDAGGRDPLATIDADQVMPTARSWPQPFNWGWTTLPDHLPRVHLLSSHADADEYVFEALLAFSTTPIRGLVLSGTGHGTLPDVWSAPLRLLHARGVAIWRSSRVARGGVSDARASSPSPWPAAGELTASQARLALSLALWRCPQAVLHPPQTWS